MPSTFMGVEIGKSGIVAHQQALHTTGHNVTNAETEGYSRQRVVLTAEKPIYEPSLNRAERAGQIGQGVMMAKIERIRNVFLDDRMIDVNDFLGYWKTRNDFLYQVQLVHNEPSDMSMRQLLNEFWSAWEELANNPAEFSVRKVVKERSETLVAGMNRTYSELKDIQNNVELTILTRLAEINDIGRKIRDLNVEIVKVEALGDTPNDLYDKRDLLVDRLSKMVNISTGRKDKDEFFVYIDGERFVQGIHMEELKAVSNPRKNGYSDIFWSETGSKVRIRGGEMKSLLDLRDDILKNQIDYLNNFTVNLADLVNGVHRDGFGLDGVTNRNFFEYRNITTEANGDYDSNNDGQADSTALFKVAGNNSLDLKNKIGIAGTITLDANRQGRPAVSINYTAIDTVEDVINRINQAGLEVVAYQDHKGSFALKATLAGDENNRDFIIRHIEDSGDFLVNYAGLLRASGAAGAYDWRTTGAIGQLQSSANNIAVTPLYDISSWVKLESAIRDDVNKIAAAGGTDYRGGNDPDTITGMGDGSVALKIAGLRYQKVMVGEHATFDDYYTALVSEVGALGEQSRMEFEVTEKLAGNLENLRKSINGVNLDEEMANMVTFQHGYNASARFISVIDKMLETIITRMGV